MNRLHQIISKLFFCIRISADLQTFQRLILNSKKFTAVSKPSSTGTLQRLSTDAEETYRLNLNLPRNVFMRTRAGDIRMFYEVFWEEAYRFNGSENTRDLTVVDAGSNVGMSAIYFLSTYSVRKLVAIEPDPSNLLLLRKNLQPETDKNIVTIVPAAISGTKGKQQWIRSAFAYNSHLATNNRPPGPETAIQTSQLQEVDTTTMQHIINEHQLTVIDILKIDIEGAEQELFAGDLRWLSIVRNLVIEIHHNEQVEPIIDQLQLHGFAVNKLHNLYSEVFLASKKL